MREMSLVLFLLCGVGAACGSASDGESVATGEDGPASFEDIEYRSPLAEYFGIDAGFGEGEDAAAQNAEVERRAQELTAECMVEQGFEYKPVDNSQFVTFGSSGEEFPYGSDGWVEKYGFGITTQRFAQSGVGDLVGYPDEQPGGADDEFVDPNQNYVESLSEAEQAAYFEALYGVQPDEPVEEGEAFEYEPAGCSNLAYEEAFNEFGSGGFDGQAFDEAFGDEFNAIYERIEADPRLVAFNAEVTDCVAEKGLVWVDMNELYERFEPRLMALQPASYAEDPFEAAGLNPEEMSEEELNAFFQELNKVPADKLALLAELQAEEIALAKAVTDCGGGPLEEEILRNELRVEYEQKFVDANADALAEFTSAD